VHGPESAPVLFVIVDVDVVVDVVVDGDGDV
jgi:hypothetical protein